MKSYIGITGFMSQREVRAMLDLIPKDSQRKLMVGVLMSWKTLNGIPNKWPNRYPDVNEVPGIFIDHLAALNLVHYHSRELATLHWQLENVTKSCGPNLHGLQLNVTWPNPIILKMYKKSHPDKIIVLQVGNRAFEMIGHSPERLAAKVSEEYKGLIDYILLDPSGGTGKEFDPIRMREYLEALKGKWLKIGLGVAGGLGPYTRHLVWELIKDNPYLSFDAEKNIRDSDDHLDLREAGEYINQMLEMFSIKERM